MHQSFTDALVLSVAVNILDKLPFLHLYLLFYYQIHVRCHSTLCLKKRHTFTTCYNFYIYSSIATIFGINVAEKVGNQNVLYFPTTSN